MLLKSSTPPLVPPEAGGGTTACAPGESAKEARASGMSNNLWQDLRCAFIPHCYRNSARKFHENFRNAGILRVAANSEMSIRSHSGLRVPRSIAGQLGRPLSELPTGEAPLLDRDRSGERFHGSVDRDKAAGTPGAAGSRGLRRHDRPMRGPAI